jgi:hypothetical protein
MIAANTITCLSLLSSSPPAPVPLAIYVHSCIYVGMWRVRCVDVCVYVCIYTHTCTGQYIHSDMHGPAHNHTHKNMQASQQESANTYTPSFKLSGCMRAAIQAWFAVTNSPMPTPKSVVFHGSALIFILFLVKRVVLSIIVELLRVQVHPVS